MANIPTPHIDAKEGQIADSILLPGDPLRAKFIAKNFLTDVKQFNRTRNILGYTGMYQGKRVSVMGTGMGVPSMGIYSYELINFYHCKKLIRVGTAGSMQPFLKIGDVVIAQGACTASAMPMCFNGMGSFAPIGDYSLIEAAVEAAKKIGCGYHVGNVLTSDFFYELGGSETHAGGEWADYGVLAVEMETAMLYLNAARGGSKALSVLSITDDLETGAQATVKERETAFTDMMQIALEIA